MIARIAAQGRWWTAAGLAAAIGTPIVLVLRAMDRVFVYLTADAGHALADGAAVAGHGVRELRHLPVFAALTDLAQSVTSDLDSLRLVAVLATVAMPVSFYFFVRGRTGSRLAEVIGTGLFAVAPPTAEAVGYYGLVSLFSIAFAIVTMRLLDDWLVEPNVGAAARAGLFVGLTALTHPLGLSWICQVGFIVLASHCVGLVRRAGRARLHIGPLLRSVVVIAAFAAVGGLVAIRFLGGLNSDLRIHPDVSRLRLVDQFGFRDNRIFWVGLLVTAAITLPLYIKLGSAGARRAAIWAMAAGTVAAVNLVAIDAHVTYESRQVYLLAFPAAVSATLLIASLRVNQARRETAVSSVAIILAGTGILAVAADAFANRLDAAVPYYSHVDRDELAAVQWLSSRPGGVLLSGRTDQFYGATDYAWIVEGLAGRKAIAPAQGFTNLITSQREESDDAARVIAGDVGTANKNLLAAASGDGRSITVLGRFDHAWYPLAVVRFPVGVGTPPTSTATAVGLGGGRVSLRATSEATVEGAPGLDVTILPARVFGPVTSTVDGDRTTLSASPDPRAAQTPSVELRRIDGGPAPVLGADGAVLFTPARAGLPVQFHISVRGISRSPQPSTTYHSSDILARRAISWIWVWDEPGGRTLTDFLSRGFRVAYRNASVVVLSASR